MPPCGDELKQRPPLTDRQETESLPLLFILMQTCFDSLILHITVGAVGGGAPDHPLVCLCETRRNLTEWKNRNKFKKTFNQMFYFYVSFKEIYF